jgi:hypothetical protein
MKNKTKTNKPKPDKDINYLIKKHYYHNDLTVAE